MSYLKSLSEEVKEMWTLVISQHKKSLTALTLSDKDLAREIILVEERVNSCGQFIESDCEHYFSLSNTQNLNIPYAMFALKISRQVEIIGDLAKKMANEILNTNSMYSHKLLEQINIAEPFRNSNKILELLLNAFHEIDKTVAQVAVSRIKVCNEMIEDTNSLLADYLKNDSAQINQALSLFSVAQSIKRTLEIAHNICSGIINYSQPSLVLA